MEILCYLNCRVPERKKAITDHPSYHGVLTQEKAEAELKRHCQQNTTCYLTRWSKYSQSFKVSVCVKEAKYHHLRLNIMKEDNSSMYELEGVLGRFNDVFKLLEFYEKNPVSDTIDAIGICLNVLRRSATDPQLIQRIVPASDKKPPLETFHSQAYTSQASYDEVSSNLLTSHPHNPTRWKGTVEVTFSKGFFL